MSRVTYNITMTISKNNIIISFVALAAVSILFLAFRTEYPELKVPPQITTSEQATSTVKTFHVEGPHYMVNAHYPKFGIPAFDARIEEEVMREIASFEQTAEEYPPTVEGAPRYEMQISFKTIHRSSEFLSLELLVSQYLGGAHGFALVKGMNFDIETGREVTLSDVLAMIGLDLDEVSIRVIGQLKNDLGEDVVFEGGVAPLAENYSAFVIDDKKVTFLFQQYQVAASAAGLPQVSFELVK